MLETAIVAFGSNIFKAITKFWILLQVTFAISGSAQIKFQSRTTPLRSLSHEMYSAIILVVITS